MLLKKVYKDAVLWQYVGKKICFTNLETSAGIASVKVKLVNHEKAERKTPRTFLIDQHLKPYHGG